MIDSFCGQYIFTGLANLQDFDSFDCKEYFNDILQARPQSFPTMSYTDQSVWWFCKRYLKTECPLVDWEEAAVAQLLDDDGFTMTVVRLEDGAACLNPFWELYGHNKDFFLPVADLAEALSLAYFLSPLNPTYTTEQRQYLLQDWAGGLHPKMYLTTKILQRLSSQWAELQRQWRALGGKSHPKRTGTSHAHPFADGLRTLAGKFHPRIIESEAVQAIDFMSKLDPSLKTPHTTSGPSDRVSDKESEICYLLASAGSGKTRRMFRMLEERFGFYIASGAIRNQADPRDTEDHLYQPRASTASGDAKLLNRTVEQARTCAYWEHLDRRYSQVSFDNRCELLLKNRLVLFYKVFEQLDVWFKSLQPWRWLRYQLSSTAAAHPFTRSFRCLYLSGSAADPILLNDSEASLHWCGASMKCNVTLKK